MHKWMGQTRSIWKPPEAWGTLMRMSQSRKWGPGPRKPRLDKGWHRMRRRNDQCQIKLLGRHRTSHPRCQKTENQKDKQNCGCLNGLTRDDTACTRVGRNHQCQIAWLGQCRMSTQGEGTWETESCKETTDAKSGGWGDIGHLPRERGYGKQSLAEGKRKIRKQRRESLGMCRSLNIRWV